ncbi:thioredoxin-like [Littorina saxatilis]|uniref:Thioredoxin n=1 Tax=Littorina saxatilis TaxID=31220 RepID=A0AAN9GAV0_9CAEN
MVTALGSADDFKKKVKLADPEKLVVVDFYATWCMPCKMIAPKIEKMAKEEFPDVLFFKVDVDTNEDTAQEEDITAMPTFHFYRNGEQIKDAVVMGANEEAIRNTIKKHK